MSRLSVPLGMALLASCNQAPMDSLMAFAEPTDTFSRDQLMNPETCAPCHPSHYRQWSASMHAYSSVDPVFRAMNARGQREAQLGEFCVQCHAPMALREGMTQDGLNLDQLPRQFQGVTCYFCHNVTGVGVDHFNNSLVLANDTTMRGNIADPVANPAHASTHSLYQDGNNLESSIMCGACHDIVTRTGVQLERTLAQYKTSNSTHPGDGFATCNTCHMDPYDAAVATNPAGVAGRTLHEHLWPAVDAALTDFPDQDVMRLAIEQCQLPKAINSFGFDLSGDNTDRFEMYMESAGGHNIPTGSSQDRRMWVEVTAHDLAGNVTHQSGVFGDDEPENFETPSRAWTLFDRIYNQRAEEVHMFWEAAPSALYGDGYASTTLPTPEGSIATTGQHGVAWSYSLGPAPARARIRVRMRPMSRDILDDLVRSGDLEPSIPMRMPTFTVRDYSVVWAEAGAPTDFDPPRDLTRADCDRYKCMLGTEQDARACSSLEL